MDINIPSNRLDTETIVTTMSSDWFHLVHKPSAREILYRFRLTETWKKKEKEKYFMAKKRIH